MANTTEGGCPGGNEGCKRQEQGSKEREDSMEMQVIVGEKAIFFNFVNNFISNKNKPVVNLLLITCIMSP